MQVAPLGPVAGAYYLDQSRIAVIEGPVGSAKSTASCLRLQRHAYEQVPSPDGVARTRFAIVRNTKKQLQDTTLKTWLQVFPQAQYGDMVAMNHVWRFKPRGFTHSIEAEFIFRALDDEKDVADLLSLEVTGFWFNELREIVRDILAHAGRRTRYLNSERPSTWSGWIGDTNPWDVNHYLQDMLVRNPNPDARHFIQPGGMEENAENLENLEQTAETLALPFDDQRRRAQGRKYYINALKDYSEEDARVYVHAQRGRTRSGKPIYTNYRDTVHCKPFELVPMLGLHIGIDFGRTPAAIIGQKRPNGNWRLRYELCAQDMGILQFGKQLAMFIEEKCPGMQIISVTGDPAGNARDGRDETAFDLLKVAKLICKPAHTNEFSVRVEVVQSALGRMADGEPGLILHPDMKMTRDGFIDGYRFRKLQIAGDRYSDEPDKNMYSHPCEGVQYLLLGGGEARVVMQRPKSPNRQRYATE